MTTAAKINLYLGVGRRQHDGYHPVETLLQTVDLGDELELAVARSPGLRLTVSGPVPVPAGEDNLVMRSARMVAEECRKRGDGPLPGLRLRLRKRVPAGAGLGGGSGNAAATLLLLDQVLDLRLGRRRLLGMARRLGADVPFFLDGGLRVGSGRGDRLRPLVPLPALAVLLMVPPFPLSTREVYGWYDRFSLTPSRSRFTMRPVLRYLRAGRCGQALVNDLEPPVFRRYPEMARAKETLLAGGALLAGMSGSGSAMFGLFHRLPRRELDVSMWREKGWQILRCHTLPGASTRARRG